MTGNLQAGERVVELVAVARSAGAVVGLISALLALRLSGRSWGTVIAVAVGCAVAGFFLGEVVGHVLFPAAPGQTVIARVGAQSLGLTLKASVSAGVVVAFAVAVVAYFTGSARAAGISFGVGIAAAAGMGCAAALL